MVFTKLFFCGIALSFPYENGLCHDEIMSSEVQKKKTFCFVVWNVNLIEFYDY